MFQVAFGQGRMRAGKNADQRRVVVREYAQRQDVKTYFTNFDPTTPILPPAPTPVTPTTSTPPAPTAANPVEPSPALKTKVEMLWPDDGVYYGATVIAYNPTTKEHCVLYAADSTSEWVNFYVDGPDKVVWQMCADQKIPFVYKTEQKAAEQEAAEQEAEVEEQEQEQGGHSAVATDKRKRESNFLDPGEHWFKIKQRRTSLVFY